MLTAIENVNGLPKRGKSFFTSRPLLNALYYPLARVFDKIDSLQVFCIIFRDSDNEIPLVLQNLRQSLCSTFLSIMKFAIRDITKKGSEFNLDNRCS